MITLMVRRLSAFWVTFWEANRVLPNKSHLSPYHTPSKCQAPSVLFSQVPLPPPFPSWWPKGQAVSTSLVGAQASSGSQSVGTEECWIPGGLEDECLACWKLSIYGSWKDKWMEEKCLWPEIQIANLHLTWISLCRWRDWVMERLIDLHGLSQPAT